MLDMTVAQQEGPRCVLHQRLPSAVAIAFGSRAADWPLVHRAKHYSDLDVALFGLVPADAQALAQLRADLKEGTLPWRVDISDAIDLPLPA